MIARFDDVIPSASAQDRKGKYRNFPVQPGFPRHGRDDLHIRAATVQTGCEGLQSHEVDARGSGDRVFVEYYSDSHGKYDILLPSKSMDCVFLIPEDSRGNQRMTESRTRMKKICLVTPEFPPETWGGLARTVRRVAEHAAGMGLDAHVAHLRVAEDTLVLLDENRRTETAEGITIHRLTVGRESLLDGPRQLWDCPHNLTLQMMYQSLEMLHLREEFDLFHSFFLYPIGYVTGLLARRMKIPHVVALVGNDVKRYLFSPEKVAVCRSGLENADRVAGLGMDLLEMADALVPIMSKAQLVYNSVEIPSRAWEPRSRGASEPCRVGCAGIFKYAKGLPYLFKALAEPGGERGSAILDLAGTLRNSERHAFHEMIQRTGIEHRIHFGGVIPHGGIFEWMRGLDAFVLPSVTEGCPNILMEAMACGLPCVATRTGANDVLMEDGVSGRLVPWGDSPRLAAALEEILGDPALAAALGRAARRRMEDFPGRREREAWEGIYREMLDF